MIISDVSKRILIVKGIEEVERIKNLYQRDKIHSINIKKLSDDNYEIEIIYSVGDYWHKDGRSRP